MMMDSIRSMAWPPDSQTCWADWGPMRLVSWSAERSMTWVMCAVVAPVAPLAREFFSIRTTFLPALVSR